MTIHLSARLAWHDRGWDGCVCNDPIGNVSCVVHDHIRDSRVDADEVENAGKHLCEISLQPPCSRDPGAYSSRGYLTTHRDPLYWRKLPSTDEEILPNTCISSPYGRMFAEEGGWELDPKKQLESLKEFFSVLSPKHSLVFYYLKDGQPFVETSQRIIAGIGRISKIGPQLFFGGPGDDKGTQYPIWSRSITQNFPAEGFRLPLQEYVQNGFDASDILCFVPPAIQDNFSYVAEHISDDVAVTIIERMIFSLRSVISEKKIKGDWQRHLNWLEERLSEVWHDRGPCPGLGSALMYLGCRSGMSFQREVVEICNKTNEDPWSFVEAILESKSPSVFPGHTKNLLVANDRWRSEPENRKELLRLLARLEVTPGQVERIMHPTKRRDSGIIADESAILENPYILAELDLGNEDSAPIHFDIIDHGMLPPADVAGIESEPINKDDNRRVRSLLINVLKSIAEDGDTILPLDETCRLVEKQCSHDRRCLPDPTRLEIDKVFFEERLTFIDSDAGYLVALRTLAEDENLIKDRIIKMVEKSYDDEHVDWDELVDQALLGAKEQRSEDETNARNEKVTCLKRAFVSRFCVIIGRAGTGKTTVAGALINGIENIEGKTSVLLLTPTGKARIRLQERTKREAKTIHQFLSENKWIDYEHGYTFRREGGIQQGAATVLIDESSMVSTNLLATLFRAIDWNDVRRLILVGDPNQLPPIGPGRPFADIIGWLDEDDGRRERLLQLRYRGRFEDANSLGLQLSDGYAMGETNPGDDEVLAKVAIGDISGSDLEVYYWDNIANLNEILNSRIYSLVLNDAEKGDYKALDASFYNENGLFSPESWQILSPVRRQPYGTDELNRLIQLEFRSGMIRMSQAREFIGKDHQLPRPAGNQQIVWKDKVIHIKNQRRWSWTEGTAGDQKRYVANGEVGIVTWAERRKKTERLTTIYGTQPNIRFKYYRNEVDEFLELAYALTVHKSQGSDFDTVFLIIPKAAAILSRELIYTALTRFKRKLILLLEQDTSVLEQFRKPSKSETLLRNTNLFSLAIRPESVGYPYPENLIHRTSTNTLVRSKSEVIVAETLTRFGISYLYEEPLRATDNPSDYRLPDFTIKYEGETWYWEHRGMMSVPSYAEAWQRKEEWYIRNGFLPKVITSEDEPDGSISVPAIEEKIKQIIS